MRFSFVLHVLPLEATIICTCMAAAAAPDDDNPSIPTTTASTRVDTLYMHHYLMVAIGRLPLTQSLLALLLLP